MPMIGVRLPASFESAGEFLADAQSLESAGADLLLLGDGDLEPDLLLAAIAAVTVRVSFYHRAPGETLRRLARGRLIRELVGWHDVPFPADQTLVVIDPPRKGASLDFLEQLMRFGPKRVVYVSCNVHTQARDVGLLVKGNGEWRYAIESVRGFDFFPQTGHVEGVAFLDREAVVKN